MCNTSVKYASWKNAIGSLVENIFPLQFHINEQYTEERKPVKYRLNSAKSIICPNFSLNTPLLKCNVMECKQPKPHMLGLKKSPHNS
jgi:hypothetical protein